MQNTGCNPKRPHGFGYKEPTMEALDMLLKYVIVPIGGFVWMIHTRLMKHATEIEVLKAQASATKEAHDREFKEMRENFKRIFEKLDGIEGALRK